MIMGIAKQEKLMQCPEKLDDQIDETRIEGSNDVMLVTWE